MKISVCIGSSCHLRGSYDIIQRLKELVARDHLEDQVELSAAFCLGQCTLAAPSASTRRSSPE